MRRVISVLAIPVVSVIVAGCQPPPPEDVEIAELQDQLLTPRCAHSACHGGATPERGLDLREGRSLESIVNVPSRSIDGAIRVVPGRPDLSLLYQVTQGERGDVRQMPLGGELSDYERELLRVWIAEGCR